MPLRRNESAKESRLHSISLFQHADQTAIEHLEQAADEIDIPKGTTILRQGQLHQEVYILLSGTLEVVIDDDTVAELSDVEVFGEISRFTNEPTGATVRAATDAKALVIPGNRFDQILDDNPQLLRAIARQLAHRLQRANRLHGMG